MKKTIIALSFAALSAALSAATVESVLVRQMWPWSTDVMVEYTLVGVTDPVDVSITAWNGSTMLDSSKISKALTKTGELFGVSSSGVHSFTFDPVAAFGASSVAMGDFRVQLSVAPSTANMSEVVYKIVDLISPYTVTDVTRGELLNGKYGTYATAYSEIDSEFSTTLSDVIIWTGVTNSTEYLTDKMVFRKIPAGGKSYMMQEGNSAVNSGAGVQVSFSNDFYISVFEVTQKQYNNFFNISPYETVPELPSMRAHTAVRPKWIRPQKWNAANAGGIHAISTVDTLCGKMQNLIGLLFDAPTEAMWEYACRAGTTGELYTGDNTHTASGSDSHALKIMRANIGSDEATAGLDKNSAIPGQYLPNAYGLYDMLGNVQEPCLDANCSVGNLPGGMNPIASSTGENMTAQTASDYTLTLRGGWYSYDVPSITPVNSTGRSSASTSSNARSLGIRLCIYLDHNDDGRKN